MSGLGEYQASVLASWGHPAEAALPDAQSDDCSITVVAHFLERQLSALGRDEQAK